jgi:hypothetical protein
MKTTKEMLAGLESLIRQGALTKSACIDYGTYVCAIDKGPANTYHQFEFESLPEEHKRVFRFQKVGAVLGTVKIVAVFDAWPDAVVTSNSEFANKPIDS